MSSPPITGPRYTLPRTMATKTWVMNMTMSVQLNNGLVEYLIQTDVDINYRDDWNETALNDAKKRGHWAIVDLLAMYAL